MIFLAMAIEVCAILAFVAWLFQYTGNAASLWLLLLLFLVGYSEKYLRK